MNAAKSAAEQPQGTHVLTVMDGFANHKVIEFEKWKSENAKSLCDVWIYNGRHYTFEQLLKIYNATLD